MTNHRDLLRDTGASEWDIARTCWVCGEYGVEGNPQKIRNGALIHGFTCKTETCRNFGTGWIVQTNADGSIPNRTAGFRSMDQTEFSKGESERILETGKRYLEQIKLDAQTSVEESD